MVRGVATTSRSGILRLFSRDSIVRDMKASEFAAKWSASSVKASAGPRSTSPICAVCSAIRRRSRPTRPASGTPSRKGAEKNQGR